MGRGRSADLLLLRRNHPRAAEPGIPVVAVQRAVSAARRSQEEREAEPGPAAPDACLTGLGTGRVSLRAALVIVLAEPVGDPLGHIAGHIVEPVRAYTAR